MLSSPNPLPIHSCPFNPSVGNKGPNAAGLAKKAVVLSFVRVMIALGGKSENGARNENNDCIPVFGAVVEAATFCGEGEDRRDKNVRKKVVRRKATIITILGGRMMGIVSNLKYFGADSTSLQLCSWFWHELDRIRLNRYGSS